MPMVHQATGYVADTNTIVTYMTYNKGGEASYITINLATLR